MIDFFKAVAAVADYMAAFSHDDIQERIAHIAARRKSVLSPTEARHVAAMAFDVCAWTMIVSPYQEGQHTLTNPSYILKALEGDPACLLRYATCCAVLPNEYLFRRIASLDSTLGAQYFDNCLRYLYANPDMMEYVKDDIEFFDDDQGESPYTTGVIATENEPVGGGV